MNKYYDDVFKECKYCIKCGKITKRFAVFYEDEIVSDIYPNTQYGISELAEDLSTWLEEDELIITPHSKIVRSIKEIINLYNNGLQKPIDSLYWYMFDKGRIKED